MDSYLESMVRSALPLAWSQSLCCPPAFWTTAAFCWWCDEAEIPEHRGTWGLPPRQGWSCTSCVWFHLKLPREQIMWCYTANPKFTCTFNNIIIIQSNYISIFTLLSNCIMLMSTNSPIYENHKWKVQSSTLMLTIHTFCMWCNPQYAWWVDQFLHVLLSAPELTTAVDAVQDGFIQA